MKKYITKLLCFISVFLTVLIFLLTMRIVSSTMLDWKLGKEKRIVFMGASHISRDIDVSQSKEAVNLGKPSERYMFTYMKLQKLVENNPQVKHIVLQCAPTDLWQHTDDKYFVDNEMSEFVPLFYPMFTNEDLEFYKGRYFDMAIFILQHSLDPRNYIQSLYFKRLGWGNQEGQMLHSRMDKSKVKPDMLQGSYGNQVNLYYLHKIVDYCKRKNIQLSLIYCPMYKPDYFYNQNYFYSQLKKFSDVKFYDYSHWAVPDSCRYDAHHLNADGAKLFTQELMKTFGFD